MGLRCIDGSEKKDRYACRKELERRYRYYSARHVRMIECYHLANGREKGSRWRRQVAYRWICFLFPAASLGTSQRSSQSDNGYNKLSHCSHADNSPAIKPSPISGVAKGGKAIRVSRLAVRKSWKFTRNQQVFNSYSTNQFSSCGVRSSNRHNIFMINNLIMHFTDFGNVQLLSGRNMHWSRTMLERTACSTRAQSTGSLGQLDEELSVL